MKLYNILIGSANAGLTLQDQSYGYMPSGHNGSYLDPETPVRNTAHWVITFLKAYQISGEKKYLNAAKKGVQYLCSSEARPMNATFWHRKNPNKDTCNGLIGQAWTIEALTIAAQTLNDVDLFSLAKQVFLLHPQKPTSGLWQSVSVDGTYLDVDSTFNHQLWFAASGALLAQASESAEIHRSVHEFLRFLPDTFQIHKTGLIQHFISYKLFPRRVRINRFIEQLWNIKYIHSVNQSKKYLHSKEIGYHSFNLYAFSLLKLVYPDHLFWSNKNFLKALTYLNSKEYLQEIHTSKFGFSYNPPGFEVPFIWNTFSKYNHNFSDEWITKQISFCYNFETNLMEKNTDDPMTHSARIYEATRLQDVDICIN